MSDAYADLAALRRDFGNWIIQVQDGREQGGLCLAAEPRLGREGGPIITRKTAPEMRAALDAEDGRRGGPASRSPHTVAAMSQLGVSAGDRLYGIMQHLMSLAADGRLPDPAPARGVVTCKDALDASLQLAAVIDEATQTGRIPPERGVHAASMLMLVRDYVKPLPHIPGHGDTDQVTPDLAEMAADSAAVGQQSLPATNA